jgi:site-specific recombinase XerD
MTVGMLVLPEVKLSVIEVHGVKAAAKRAGVNPAVSEHWLRHPHACNAIDNGAPITLVSATPPC